MSNDYTLAELCICAAAEAFRDDDEILATGIGVIPRLAASLAMKSFNPDLMMTDSEAWMISEPNPIGDRGADFVPSRESWMGFSRIFDNVWSGKRHAMLGPTQVDRFGQSNTSALGGSYEQPKVMMLGARGFPGNSISHPNSFFVPGHSNRVFIEGECDFVSSIGYNPERLPKGHELSYLFEEHTLGQTIGEIQMRVDEFGGRLEVALEPECGQGALKAARLDVLLRTRRRQRDDRPSQRLIDPLEAGYQQR